VREPLRLRAIPPTAVAARPRTSRVSRGLRLTVGLRKTEGRWIVVHEHHSFPDTTSSPEALDGTDRQPPGVGG
jgi:hypothetical protein